MKVHITLSQCVMCVRVYVSTGCSHPFGSAILWICECVDCEWSSKAATSWGIFLSVANMFSGNSIASGPLGYTLHHSTACRPRSRQHRQWESHHRHMLSAWLGHIVRFVHISQTSPVTMDILDRLPFTSLSIHSSSDIQLYTRALWTKTLQNGHRKDMHCLCLEFQP